MKRPLISLPKRYDNDKLLHHYFRFGLIGNFRVLMCRMFGHRVSHNPKYNCCARCGLVYEEIYHKVGKGWFVESGIVEEDEERYFESTKEIEDLLKDSYESKNLN